MLFISHTIISLQKISLACVHRLPHLAEFSTMKDKEFPQIELKSHLEVLFVKNCLMKLRNPGLFKDS